MSEKKKMRKVELKIPDSEGKVARVIKQYLPCKDELREYEAILSKYEAMSDEQLKVLPISNVTLDFNSHFFHLIENW